MHYIRVVQKFLLFGLLTSTLVSCSSWLETRVSHRLVEIDSLSFPYVYSYNKEPFNGIVEIRNDDDSLLEEMYISDGIQQGPHRIYDTTGYIKAEKNMTNGVQDGISTYYRPDGKVSQTHEFVQGRLGGKSIFYHKNGKVRLLMQFSPSGKKSGTWYEYDLQGNIIKETHHP
ncbi:MAG: toxin-antitoxin system YwqK family antitoxin [Flavobacteriaceae bacterium]